MARSRRKRYRVKELLLLFLFIIVSILIIINNTFVIPHNYSVGEIPSKSLEKYFSLESEHEISWYYFAAMDDIDGNLDNAAKTNHYEKLAALYFSNEKNLEEALLEYKGKRYKSKLEKHIKRFETIDRVVRDKIFPLPLNISYEYDNGWGNDRSYGGERKHEGIDIMTGKGVSILSVGEGFVQNIGWNELGGWRIGVKGRDGVYYYYAHLDHYANSIEIGDEIHKGELLGYVGNSGYGPEGTMDQFVDHLHFGMYIDNQAVNPYPFIKVWEQEIVN